MGIARALDSLRKATYTGKLKALVTALGLNQYASDVFWGVYERATGGEMRVTVGDATAVLSTATFSEYRMVATVRGVERPVVREILADLEPDDVYWDVGANVGTFACLAGDVLEEGAVVAFEPYPPNVERLRANLEANDVDSTVKPVALSDSAGDVEFYVLDTTEAGTQQGSIETDYASTDRAVETITVEATTGDSLVAGGDVPQPHVVKIDVEGAAPAVLRGMASTLAAPQCRTVVVEPHDNLEAVEAALVDSGFRVEDDLRPREGQPPTLVARDPESATEG